MDIAMIFCKAKLRRNLTTLDPDEFKRLTLMNRVPSGKNSDDRHVLPEPAHPSNIYPGIQSKQR